ncbi:MAG: hypothetical protein M1820_007172 [Bogoriella megaspora]|nr:MAG: hypothetical protein M1820_007172 [Bogoriella megaspora]
MAELDPMDRVVIVTGASKGKCHVVAIARSEKLLQDLEQSYHETGRLITLRGDVADPKFCGQIADETMSRWGRVDGLIVNHGVLAPVKRISESFVAEWKEIFDINVFGTLALIKACLPFLKHNQGRIILCSSGASVNAYASWGAYGASKAVLNHLALTLAVEEPEITTIAIRPGVVDTDMQKEIRESHHDKMDEKDTKKFADLHRTGGLLEPEQPGHVMAKLALDGPKDLNGKLLNWNDVELDALQGH